VTARVHRLAFAAGHHSSAGSTPRCVIPPTPAVCPAFSFGGTNGLRALPCYTIRAVLSSIAPFGAFASARALTVLFMPWLLRPGAVPDPALSHGRLQTDDSPSGDCTHGDERGDEGDNPLQRLRREATGFARGTTSTGRFSGPSEPPGAVTVAA